MSELEIWKKWKSYSYYNIGKHLWRTVSQIVKYNANELLYVLYLDTVCTVFRHSLNNTHSILAQEHNFMLSNPKGRTAFEANSK